MNLKEPDLQNFEEKQGEVVDNLLAPSSWIIAFCKVQLPRPWLVVVAVVASPIISSRSTKTQVIGLMSSGGLMSSWFCNL